MKKKKRKQKVKLVKPSTIPSRPSEEPTKTLSMPGDPSNRTLLATDADDSEVRRAFKDNPSSKWIITTSRIVERDVFYAEKPK